MKNNNQPQRLLSKKRKSSERQGRNGDDDSSTENDGWISTKPKQKSATMSLSLVDHRKKNAVSFAKKPSTFAARDDSSSSSSSDSDDSHMIITKRNKKKTNHNNEKSTKTSSTKSKKPTIARATFAKVANRVSKAGTRASTTPENAPSSTAASKANKAAIPEGITSPSQLQWYRIILGQSKKGSREKLQPCRKLSRGEVFEYKRKHGGGDFDNNNRGTTFIEYLTLSNDKNNKKHIICVDDNLLIPFGYRSRDGVSYTFNDDYLQRYMQEQRNICSPSQLEAQKLFIERVFHHAIQIEKESKEDAKRDFEDYYGDSSIERGNSRVQFEVDEESSEDENERSDDDELDIPYTQAISLDPDNFEPIDENETSNEPMRVGDVIQYYSPIFVAGDPRGLREATVLAIDPKKENPLVLDNAEYIPNDINVKRIKVISGGELVDHPGIFRPIFRFKLVKAGKATMADAVKMQSSRFGGIMRNNMKKLKSKAEAEGFAPMDLMVNIKGVNDSSQSSSSSSRGSVIKPKASRKVQRELSSSSSSSDDESSDDESPVEKSKPLAAGRREIGMEEAGRFDTPKLKENKENASSASRRDRKLSLGSLSSKASLGTSLATSDDDDSSIESIPLNLGKNHRNMTQNCQQNKHSDVSKKAKTSGVLDLSISSDDSVHLSPSKTTKKSTGAPSAKQTKVKEHLLSSDSSESSSSESSLEVIKPKKSKNTTLNTSSCSAATGSSKQCSEFRKRTPDSNKSSSSYSSSASKASLSENSSASIAKRKRTPTTNHMKDSSKVHSSTSSKTASATKQQKSETDSEATKDLGWTQTSGGWVKSNENAGFSLSIGRFKK